MKSLVKPEVETKLNDLLQRMFYLNAVFDNIAYNLEKMGYHNASDIFHKALAHKPPVWADDISDFMYNLGLRAVRKGIPDQTEEYTGVDPIFRRVYKEIEDLCDYIARIIEELDFDYKNRYAVISLENLLEKVQPWVRVADTWADMAIKYDKHDNLYKFDKDFHKFIKLPE